MAGQDGTIALMTAVRTLLLADTTLQGLGITQVYDRPSPNLNSPYVTIGATRYSDWSWFDGDGQEHRLDVNVWDSSPGQLTDTLRLRQVMARVRAVLHYATPALAAPFNLVLMQVIEATGAIQDPDGTTLHGIVTVRALIDHT